MQRTLALTLLLSGFALQGCGTSANASISPSSTNALSRTDAINHVANTACERADKCLQIGGKDGKWSTLDDCLNDQRAAFSKKWTAEMCGDPHGVIEGQLATCENSVEKYSCSDSLFDLPSVLSECSENDLCK